MWWIFGYTLLVVLPVGHVAMEVATWVRNIPNWDEFDTVLAWLIALDDGVVRGAVAKELFAVQNEHRTAVSRLLVAAIFGLTGGINFQLLAVLGNLFLAGVFAVLLAAVAEREARWRLAAVFAPVVCQLQHHESWFWAGSSIDHFFVVLAVAGALVALGSARRGAFGVGVAAAALATFSLAHGLLVWPLGAAWLAAERRWRELRLWLGIGVVTVAVFFAGFRLNPGHRLPQVGDLPAIVVYWLTLIGSSPALDDMAVAPWLGAGFLAAAGWAARRGVRPSERLAGAMVLWCLGAMAMIAWGRALLAGEWVPVASRYVILSSIAWALLIWIGVERAWARWEGRRRREWWLAPLWGGLIVFNLTANEAHEAAGRVFAQRMEEAVRTFQRQGTFARAATPLYPDPQRADEVIRAAAARGIYRLPDVGAPVVAAPWSLESEDAHEIGDAVYFIEECAVGPENMRVRGWAFRRDHTMRLGCLAVAFRGRDGVFAFAAKPVLRPDVAKIFKRSDAVYAGFELTMPKSRLPRGELDVGMVFSPDDSPEYMMTAGKIARALP